MPKDTITGDSGAARTQPVSAPKARLLLVLPIVPWPVRRNGISLRFAPIIEYLAQRYQLDVLVLAEEEEPVPSSAPIQQCHSVTTLRVPIPALAPWLRKPRTVFRTLLPWDVGSSGYANDELERKVRGYLADKRYSAAIWADKHLNIACRIRRRYPQTRFVIDFVDSPTLSSRRSVPTDPFVRMLINYSGWKWRRLEKRARHVFDAAIYVSPVDARAVPAGDVTRIHVVPNGIFDGDAPPLANMAGSGTTIGFLGHMSYRPNISAAIRLANQIFPRVQNKLADATLLIIGRDPAPEIARLRSPVIDITGTVDNIWPHIARANIFVFPMIEGTGLQNKILEVMYAGVPIVTTTIAAIGIGATSGEQLLVADTDNEIAEQVLRVLRDPGYGAALADRARRFVTREFSWPAILPRYEAIVAPH